MTPSIKMIKLFATIWFEHEVFTLLKDVALFGSYSTQLNKRMLFQLSDLKYCVFEVVFQHLKASALKVKTLFSGS